MVRVSKIMTGAAATLLLGGCGLDAHTDMQGYDPVAYYAEHPIKNSIQLRNQSVRVHFAAGKDTLSPDEIDRLSDSLHGISMPAVESIQVGFAKAEAGNEARKEHLTRMLRNMGYAKGNYMFEPLSTLKSGDVLLDVTYAAVVPPPDCPDWRRSSVTTHSNTSQGNFSCAHEVNLGLMVADPHDLVQGSSGGDVPINTQRASKVLENYRKGQTPAAASVSATSPSGGGSGGSSSGNSAGTGGGAQ